MRFVVKGTPTPLKRHRTCKGRTYNPQSVEMNLFGWYVKTQSEMPEKPIDYPIMVNMIFYMPIPKSFSKKKQEKLIDSPHIKKPDLSNLIKFVEDSLNGILWRDDSIICNLISRKIYSRVPRTVITIEEQKDVKLLYRGK